LFGNGVPGLIGVEKVHFLELVKRLGSQVFLVDNTVVAHDERLHPGDRVFGRGGDESKAPNHHSFYDEVHLTKRRGGPLPFQNLEEVSMVGFGTASVALLDRKCDLLAYGPAPRAIGILPCQTILLSRGANDALGVLVDVILFVGLERIFVLRFYVTVAYLDGIEFIRANPPIYEFLAASFSVKEPLISDLHERDREGPLFITHEKKRTSTGLRVQRDFIFLPCLSHKVGIVLLILRELAAEYYVFGI